MNKANENAPIIVGLDIGTTKTVMIVGRRNQYGKIEVIGYGKSKSKGMTKAEVVNVVDTANSIKEALDQCLLSNEALVQIKDVIVGIAGKHILCITEQASLVRANGTDVILQEEIDDLIAEQYNTYIPSGCEIINVVPKTYVIDGRYVVSNPVGCVGKKVEATFNLICGAKEEIYKIEKAVGRAGLRIQKMYLQPLASSMSVLSIDQKKAGVVVVDIGGGTTDIAIFQEGALVNTMVIDLGGEFITDEIYKSLSLFRREDAEEL